MQELSSQLAEPPAELAAPCADPDPIPPGPMSAGAALQTLADDRAALRACAARHQAAEAWRKKRDAGLAGED